VQSGTAGLWTIPGGGVDPEEVATTSAVRETEEEVCCAGMSFLLVTLPAYFPSIS
jgi:ADP-ribose pyrophosphatase YjhB (NUDIX family)